MNPEAKQKAKTFVVYYRSRYHPLEGLRKTRLLSTSKRQLRADFFEIMETDEYRIVRCEEQK